MNDVAAFTVNGDAVPVAAAPQTPLIYVLRNDLGLRGVRTGCARGSCGSCTVLVDGVPTRSCITPVSAVVGAHVTTPEGLGTPDAPHPVQQVFLDEQAAQCGYCVNGIIMTAAGLAERRPSPDEAAVRRALEDHMCRCGTHQRLGRAVRRAVGVAPGPDLGSTVVDGAAPRKNGQRDQPELPATLRAYPRIEHWLQVMPDGRVRAETGKVEIGQGIRAALARVVAAQLGISPERVDVASTTTSRSPDEGYTAGSASIDEGGTALASAAVALRRELTARAAAHLAVAAEELSVQPGGELMASSGRSVSFSALVAAGPVIGPIEPSDLPDWSGQQAGTPRRDLPAKLTGTPAYVHDLTLPGMVHARVLLPPTYDAQLEAADFASASATEGVVSVERPGNFVLVVAEREEQAVAAIRELSGSARWSDPGLDIQGDPARHLRSLPIEPFVAREDHGVDDVLAASGRISASYEKPYQAHGAIAPSCAVAVHDQSGTRVWTHTQGVYPLRRELAALVGDEEERLVVEHVDGPGCYGQNCADDAAALAVLAARAVAGRPVRFLFSVEDEFGWEPHGPAMVADLDAALDDSGRLVAWSHRATTDVHSTRPAGSGDRLLAAWLQPGAPPRPWPGPMELGARNAKVLYDVACQRIVANHVRGPVRTGALRSLGAYLNVFASESFVDEVAEKAKSDPVAFRLAHLSDARARRVLEVAADAAGWVPHVGPSGRGQGVALARYKGIKAYVAQVVDLHLDEEARNIVVDRIVVVCDAGTIIDADGLRNQLEGGTLQGLSRAMYERLDVHPDGIRSRDWTTYPVLAFADVPRVEIVLVDGAGRPPLGAGEAATPPVPAALANAVDDAIGVRLRTLPITYDGIERRLEELDDDEAARVLL